MRPFQDILGRIQDEMAFGSSRGLAGTSFAPRQTMAGVRPGIGDDTANMSFGDNNGPPMKALKAVNGSENFVPMQNSSGLEGIQAQVIELMKQNIDPDDGRGYSVMDIQQRLPGFKIHEIKAAVDYLSNEGHIYSTVDDEHYKICE